MQPPRRKNSSTVIILVVVGAIFGICIVGVVAVAWFLRGISKSMGPWAGCIASFQVVQRATVKYAGDHDGALPRAATWQEDVTPYLDKSLKEMKDVPFFEFKMIEPGKPWGCVIKDKEMTGMAFNSDLSGKKMSEITDPYSTYMVFEIEKPRMNAAEPYKYRDRASSPVFMGERRGWIKVPVYGEGDFGTFGSGSPQWDEEPPKGKGTEGN